MKREYIIRLVAGTLVLAGLAAGVFVNRLWLIVPAFVGLNLIQSAFSGWCLLESILKKYDIGKGDCCC